MRNRPLHRNEIVNRIFLSYDFIVLSKLFPYLKNATAQAWAFSATTEILNAGTHVLKAWQMFTDLETSIDTAGNLNQIQVQIELTGTQFGVKPPGIPMPKTIKHANDGYKCPAPTKRKTSMYLCCVRNLKAKVAIQKTKLLPRKNGDLTIIYYVLQSYGSNYLAQVTIDNNHPLGRFDHWNLTWEWMRGEFIYSMRRFWQFSLDPMLSICNKLLNSPDTKLFLVVDYLDCIYGAAGQYYQVMNFSKVMNCQKRPIISDMPCEKANDAQVEKLPYLYKIPPNVNRTTLYPPEKWKIAGVVNPNYKCGQPFKVEPTLFTDTSGLQATSIAIASWQIVCNISRPTNDKSRCSQALLLPSEALLIPFKNRITKAKAWVSLKNFQIPKKLPCGDNCGFSINWHVSSYYKILFNYFNGVELVMGETNGSNPKKDPRVPGKQQFVISLKKSKTPRIKIVAGDGFPSKMLFNGEKCSLPTQIPIANGNNFHVNIVQLALITLVVVLLVN
ncbi:hypothetical protein ACOSP7_012975 [Xanthoceras sorbifolium]